MNKKFSTLMAGFLLTSAFSSAQISLTVDQLELVKDDKTIQAGGRFFIIESNDEKLDANDQIFAAQLDETTGKIVYSSYAFDTYDLNSNYKKDNLLWDLGVKPVTEGLDGVESFYYTLKNVGTNSFLSSDGKTEPSIINDVVESPLHGKKADETPVEIYSYFATGITNMPKIKQAAVLFAHYPSVNLTSKNQLQAKEEGGLWTIGLGSGVSKKLLFCTYKTQSANIELMNQTMGGEGFALDFDKLEDYEDNVFATTPKFKAFTVAAPGLTIDMGDQIVHKIPAGTYLAVDYPESLNGKNVIANSDQFMACSFLAVNPVKDNKINTIKATEGNGFEFAITPASVMNFVEDNTLGEAFIPGETYVGNACFAIEVPNFTTNEEAYQFRLPEIRIKGAADATAWTVVKNRYVASHKELSVSYIVTKGSDAITFETTNTTIYQPKKLLSSEDAPAIYTIQFVSGADKENDSEYGQYLTVGATSAWGLYSTADENVANDPMYQFVITKVDTTKKIVRFTNRQAKALYFETSLYTIDEDNLVFDLLSETTMVNIAVNNKDNKTEFKQVELNKKQVKLTPVTVENQFATFDAAKKANGLVTFELGYTKESASKLYVVAQRDANKAITAGRLKTAEDFADQFELIQVQTGNEKPKYVWNPYVFVKANGEVATSTKRDTVAYNTYKIKLFAPEIDKAKYYVDQNTYLTTIESSAQEFIVKTNLDGSVSLISSTEIGVAYTPFFNSTVTAKENDAWTTGSYYKFDGINSVKTFMVAEPEAISLEAKPQHVSFNAVRGGFISMNEDKDASLAIATEASEALTIWIDTVRTNETIPSFYIAQGGNYLYHALDSMNTLTGKDKYELEDGDAKLIFKAAELVSSDTLKTMVEGKDVLVVAEKRNPTATVKAGLENFQYQIIKDEAGSDEYVIRKTGTYSYVRVINNLLTLTNSKKEAARFYVESQSAPTANEGIATSEVTVIAGEGNVTIAGAAGKKVVVSNILGQVVANTVISSDNATIAAPQGVVVVAIEGEEAVKAIVK